MKSGYMRARALKRLLLAALCLALVVALNWGASKLPGRIVRLDASRGQMMTFSEEGLAHIDAISGKATAYLVTSGDENEWIAGLLDRLAARNDNISVGRLDPVKDAAFIANYTAGTLSNNSLLVAGEKRGLAIDYNSIMVNQYMTYSGTQYLMDVTFGAEGTLVNALEYATSENVRVLYEVKNHGETALTDAVRMALARELVEVKPLNLADGVPEDAAGLLMNGPTGDISPKETGALRAYLVKGGTLALLSAYSTQNTPYLDAVTSAYGMKPVGGVVLESDANHYTSSSQYTIVPTLASSGLTDGYLAREQAPSLILPVSHALERSGVERDTLTVTELAHSSDTSYLRAIDADYADLAKADTDVAGPFCVGMMAEETIGDATARVVWIPCSNLLIDSLVGYTDVVNIDLAVSAAWWGETRPEPLTAIAAKSTSGGYLTFGAAGTWVKLALIVVPLALLVACFAVGARKGKAKEKAS